MRMILRLAFVVAAMASLSLGNRALGDKRADDTFQLMDIFHLEYASDPQISPDGKRVVYVRNAMDVQKDRRRSSLWLVDVGSGEQRAVASGPAKASMPRWSPDGKRLLYLSKSDGIAALQCRWMDTGQTAELMRLASDPAGLSWSPDGKLIALSLHVPEPPKPFVELPAKPEGAEWAEPFRMIRELNYRADGKGFLKEGRHHLFVLPAEGGTPRHLTKGPYDHRGDPAWTPDGKALIFSANRRPEGEYDPLNTEVYELTLADGSVKALTDRQGPDTEPVVSRDGKHIAYLGFDDRYQGYQVTRLYVMDREGRHKHCVSEKFDRSLQKPAWNQEGNGVFCQYDDRGVTKIALVALDGKVTVLAANVGGTTLDRPYASGSFSVSNDVVAFTETQPDQPADVAVSLPNGQTRRLTSLNADVLTHKSLAKVEEILYKFAPGGRQMQGWLVLPPHFDPHKKYPLILEIHGGPFANYGPRFAADMQLYAAAGYVVLYANPRGSTGYGEEFGNLIHHNYPGHDYDDLMSGVDAVVKRGFVDEKNLFVTGGSGGGILTSWIVGKTHRFRAAVACKPVINWYSFALTADIYPFFVRYWFPGPPWEHPEHYLKRSPLSLVGNVTTPTMLLTGTVDYRTPMSESEQFYQALKLRKVDTALVRVPGASHDIAARPSHMMAKAAYVLKWFETHRQK